MGRTSKVLNVSLPPEMLEEYERLAREQHKSKSELFREMMQVYKRERVIGTLERLQVYGSKKARQKGVFTEKDAERLVFQGR